MVDLFKELELLIKEKNVSVIMDGPDDIDSDWMVTLSGTNDHQTGIGFGDTLEEAIRSAIDDFR